MKLITHNYKAKILCLMFGFVLWLWVASGASRAGNFPGDITLQFRNVPGGLIAISDVDKIKVRLIADAATWKQLTPDSFSAYVDLNGLTAGVNNLDIIVTTNVSGVQIVEKSPAGALVRLEPAVTKKIPVSTKIEGRAGDGLVAGKAKIEPEEVEVSGAKSIIDKVLEATASVILSGETQDVSKTVKLASYDAEGKPIAHLNFSPAEVTVSVPIIKAEEVKSVGIRAVMSGRPKSGLWISSIVTEPSSVSITGAGEILTGVDYLETKEINIDSLQEDKSFTVLLDLPEGISLLHQDENRVRVTLKVESVSSEKELTAGVNYVGLAPGLKVGALNPGSIKVLITGRVSDLEGANANNVVLNLDLSTYRSAGSYSIDLTKAMFNTPSGVILSGFVPSAVKVTLESE